MAPSREVGDRPNGNGSTDRLLGELIAEVRTVKHTANGASQKIDAVAGKVDALALVVATQGQLRDHVERLEKRSEEQDEDIEALKADKLRRDGAMSLGNWLLRNWPMMVGLLVLILVVLKANGKF